MLAIAALEFRILVDYCITVRALDGEKFSDKPGSTSFLEVQSGQTDFAKPQNMQPANWVKAVMGQMPPIMDATGVLRSDLLVFIHGFDNEPPIILQRQRALKAGLAAAGYKGAVISFDWPSGDVALSYIPDRLKARDTAYQLVTDCIGLFLRTQAVTDCKVNVHILAHSTGAYVVREAFRDADYRAFHSSFNWTVSQLVFIGGDISSSSMSQGNSDTKSVYNHCVRLTNYSNPHDEVLQLSNVKRAGLEPRVGRVGLPNDAPSTAVDVNCGDYYQAMIKVRDPKTIIGIKSHSWHIGDPVFTLDLAYTLNGNIDRSVIPTRKPLDVNRFELIKPPTA